MCSRQQQMGRSSRTAQPSCRTCAGDWGREAGSAQLCRALTSPVYPRGINLLKRNKPLGPSQMTTSILLGTGTVSAQQTLSATPPPS